MASWTWSPVGGDWTYIANMQRLYEENGYEVIPFSTQNEKNVPNDYEEFFVKAYDYKELNKKKSIGSSLKALKNSVVSLEAMKNIDALLDIHDIAFAHLHIIHHWVTPAIIWKLKERGIPIIWTLHEYKLLCPEGSFVSHGKVCEKCFGGKFYSCATNTCKKGSFLASSLASFDAYFYNKSGIYNKVDAYLCPSEFLLKKFKQFNFQESKLKLTNYCYDIASIDAYLKSRTEIEETVEPEKFILYVGRIEKLKGIKTLIDAVEHTPIKLKIAGTGAYLDEATEYVQKNNITNVQFIGFQTKDSVYDLTVRSVCVVCPSEWYENYPFSVIESLLLSKPVIGSTMGGIPELVLEGKTGFLHEPGDSLTLREKMLILWDDKGLCEKLGRQARDYAYSKVNFDTHWDIIKNIIDALPIKSGLAASESVEL